MSDRFFIREILPTDPPLMAAAFSAQGWNKPLSQFLRYYEEHISGKRTVILAEVEKEQSLDLFAGYLTIMWESDYPPFRDERIPEIVDFNVLIKYRRQGIGNALMDEAERRIARISPVAGIGVGLTADYGPAHILYVKRGYIPDGRGLFFHGHHLQWGESCIVNDDLSINFTKSLR